MDIAILPLAHRRRRRAGRGHTKRSHEEDDRVVLRRDGRLGRDS